MARRHRVTGGGGPYWIQDTAIHVGVGTGDDAPLCSIPMFGQRLKKTVGNSGIPHTPDVIRRDGCDSAQDVRVGADVWTGNDFPLFPVPVKSERLKEATGIAELPHGPHIVGGDGRGSI